MAPQYQYQQCCICHKKMNTNFFSTDENSCNSCRVRSLDSNWRGLHNRVSQQGEALSKQISINEKQEEINNRLDREMAEHRKKVEGRLASIEHPKVLEQAVKKLEKAVEGLTISKTGSEMELAKLKQSVAELQASVQRAKSVSATLPSTDNQASSQLQRSKEIAQSQSSKCIEKDAIRQRARETIIGIPNEILRTHNGPGDMTARYTALLLLAGKLDIAINVYGWRECTVAIAEDIEPERQRKRSRQDEHSACASSEGSEDIQKT